MYCTITLRDGNGGFSVKQISNGTQCSHNLTPQDCVKNFQFKQVVQCYCRIAYLLSFCEHPSVGIHCWETRSLAMFTRLVSATTKPTTATVCYNKTNNSATFSKPKTDFNITGLCNTALFCVELKTLLTLTVWRRVNSVGSTLWIKHLNIRCCYSING